MNRKIVSMVLVAVLVGLVLPGCALERDLEKAQANKIDEQATQLEERDVQIERLKTELAELPEDPKDPSYSELIRFMEEDQTNKLKNLDLDYIRHAQIFLKAAREKDIKGYLVVVWIRAGYSWFFTGFNTTDKGWIYILPVDDTELKLEEGQSVNKLNNTFGPAGVDDTILHIVIFD